MKNLIPGLGNWLKQKPWEKNENLIDLWICKYFKILPKDEKFLSMDYEEKIVLFEGINNLSDERIIAKSYAIEREREKLMNMKDEEFISKKVVDNMRSIMMQQGIDEKEIQNQIHVMAETKRKDRLNNLGKFEGIV